MVSQAFPRFYYVSDDSLLDILSSPTSTQPLLPHLHSLFAAVRSLAVDSTDEEEPPAITTVVSEEGEELKLSEPVRSASRLFN